MYRKITCSFLVVLITLANISMGCIAYAKENVPISGVSETNYMRIDGLFADESYVSKTNDKANEIRLYVFYTVFSNDKNLKVDSKKSMSITINDVNTYESNSFDAACLYMESYSHRGYLETIYLGEELKMASTFIIPKAELATGRTITLNNHQIPEIEKISLITDDVIILNSAEEIANVIDPEGYENMSYKLAPADDKSVKKVKNAINDYYWTFYVNNLSYKIEFWNNNYALSSMLGETEGKYSVRNGFIVVENSTTGAVNYIPYSWGPSDIELEVTDAFDFNERYF